MDTGWLWKQTLGNGAVTTYAYNALGQTTDLANRTGGGALLSEFATPNQGGYDGAGNRTALAVTLPNAPAGYSGLTAYGYDAKDQLTQEASQRAGGYTQGFGYDGAGNATTFRGTSRAFNSNNQHTANTYDGNGNPTAYGGSALAFDPESRATAFGSALSAGYTGDSLRAWKQSGGGKTYLLYDGEQPVCEVDASGTVTAVSTFGANGLQSRWSRFHFVPASPPPPEMAMPADPPPVDLFYTFDMQGNTAQRLNAAGNVASSDAYDAFGSRVSTAGGGDVFGFGGQWGYRTDAETGLVLCTHRYYDPGTGRWLTRDPMGYAGGVNLYGYCGNNPVNESDPLGLATIQVRYKHTAGPFHHAYIVIIDNDGHTRYFARGGPADDDGVAFGSPIAVHIDVFLPSSIDWPTSKEPTITVVKDGRPASYYLNQFGKEKAKINTAGIPYSVCQNSNTVATDLLTSAGLPVPRPPVVVPGYYNSLWPPAHLLNPFPGFSPGHPWLGPTGHPGGGEF